MGGETYSDPINFPITAGHVVFISIYVTAPVDWVPAHDSTIDAFVFGAPTGSGDHTTDIDGNAVFGQDSSGGYFTTIVTGLDIATHGTPTFAVVGNGYFDNATTNSTTFSKRVANDLFMSLSATGQAGGVVDDGIQDDTIMSTEDSRDLLARIDRDVLTQPNLGTVIIYEGLADIIGETSPTDLETAGYTPLINELQAWGITIIIATLTPCNQSDPCTDTTDANRLSVNGWITSQISYLPPTINPADFATAVSVDDPSSTTTPRTQILSSDADLGDHLNLTDNGYATVTNTIPLTSLVPNIPPAY
jgi:hypothetical protein